MNETNGRIWMAGDAEVQVDEATMRAVGDLPCDPVSGILGRPNILMFGDFGWNSLASDEQQER